MAYEALYEFLKTEYAGVDKERNSLFRLTADGANPPEEDRGAYNLLREISSLYRNRQTGGANGSEYFPGQRVSGAIFSLEDITEDKITLLKSLDYDSIPAPLSSKVCDVVWLVSKDYKYAIKAAKYLIKLFDETLDSENWVDCVDAIEQGIALAKKVGAEDIAEDALHKIYDSIVAVDGTDTMFFTIQLLEVLIQYKYGTKEQKEKCLYLTDRVIENTISHQPVRVDKVKDAYKLKEKLLNLCGRSKEVTACRLDYADFLVKETKETFSNSRDVFLAVKYLTEAVKIYRENGRQDKAEETHQKLIDAQSHIHATMHVYSKSMDLTSFFQYINAAMEELSFEEKICYLFYNTRFNNIEETKL